MRSAEGGNKVDEGTLAQADCEANLARKGEDRFGRQYARIQDRHSELFG